MSLEQRERAAGPAAVAPEPATSDHEEPIFLRSGPDHIFGIMTRPTVPASGIGIVCLHARNRNNTANRNQTGARLGRALAARGALVLRVDFHGTGDSTGILERGRLIARPGDDLLAAVELLRERGADRIIVAGVCYGALVGLANADKIPDLAGIVMVNPPFATLRTGQSIKSQHDKAHLVARRVLTWSTIRLLLSNREYRRWFGHRARLRLRLALGRNVAQESPAEAPTPGAPAPSPTTPLDAGLTWLSAVLGRGLPVRMLFAQYDRVYRDFTEAQEGPLGDVITEAGELVDVVVAPGDEFGLLTSLRGQQLIVETTVALVERLSR